MTRPLQLTVTVAILMAVLAAAGFVWHQQAVANRWVAVRPDLPPRVGDAAPSLDSRLAACAEKFARQPVDSAALTEFAYLCHANGLFPDALRAYAALGTIEPNIARWPHLQAAILTGYGRLEEALPLLERATFLAPKELIVWLRLGAARLKHNDLPEAAAAFDSALQLQPTDVYALFGRARCDLQSGRLTAARARLQEAVAANPDFPGAQTLLNAVFEQLGNPDAARTARERVRSDGRYTEAPDPWAVDLLRYGYNPYQLMVAAAAVSSDGDPRSALPLLERALSLAPRDARILRQQAKTLVKLGDLAAARPSLERALALDPANEKVRTDLITVLKALRDTAATEETVRGGVITNPDWTAFRYEAGLIAARQGNVDEAAAYFNEVWTREPSQTAAPCKLATLYFAHGQEAKGQAVLESLMSGHPDDEAVLTLQVRRGIELRDPRTGEWLRRAQDISQNPPVLAELRQAYFARFGTMP